MSNVINMRPATGQSTSQGEPPDNGGMEHRITALETRLDTILPTLATKADIGVLQGEFKGWTLTTALTIVGTMVAGFIGIASLLNKQAVPAASPQSPIIINVPGAQAAPLLAPSQAAPVK